jgi:hypothetical protein
MKGKKATMKSVLFGVEFSHTAQPEVEFFGPSTRIGPVKFWADSYSPANVARKDGKDVLRERVVLKLPAGFRLRKDEVQGEVVRRGCNYQDAKFHVLSLHSLGVYKTAKSLALDKQAAANLKVLEAAKEKKDGQSKPVDGPAISGADIPEGFVVAPKPEHGGGPSVDAPKVTPADPAGEKKLV